MAITVPCAGCRTPLAVPDTLRGKKAKCPKCGEVFQAASSADEDIPTAKRATTPRTPSGPKGNAALPGSLPAARRRVRRDDDGDDDRFARPKRRRRKPATNRGLIVGLGVGGCVLAIAVVGIGIIIGVRSRTVAPVAAPQVAQAVVPVPDPVPVVPPKVEPVLDPQPVPAPVAQALEDPVAVAEVEKPAPAPVISDPPPPPVERPRLPPREPPTSLLGGKLQPGTKVTIRTEISGSPSNFQGDYSKHVIQKLEIALRELGYEPVPEGGLILQVRAQIGGTGNTFTVRPLGGPVRPLRPIPKIGERPMPLPSLIPPAQSTPPSYPVQQITATLVLTDMRGSALWNNNLHQESHLRIFRTSDPPGEMREQLWHVFDAWIRLKGIATMQ